MNDSIDTSAGVVDTTFVFDDAIRAFGGDFNLAEPGGEGFGITVGTSNGSAHTLGNEIPNSTNGFWGFVSTDLFTTVSFGPGTQTSGGGFREAYTLDDLTTAPVPLPAALPLLLAGLGGLAMVRRRKKS